MPNLVFYDFETCSSNVSYGQIIQAAAVLVNDNFQELDRYEGRCKLSPGVVPEAMALLVNKTTPKILKETNLSHYQMIRQMMDKFNQWKNSVFFGYNSIDFDEEFLRRTLFKNLEYPYITVTNGNERGDLLGLARAAHLYYPNCIKTPISDKNNPVFKLAQLAPMNGIKHDKAHSAMGDVLATVEIAKILNKKAPNVWKASLMTTNKDKCIQIIKEEKLVRFNYKFNDNKVYLFAMQGDKTINSVLIYAADITSAVKAEEEVINTQKEIVYAMGEIGETRSKETGNHVKRVAKYSKLLAKLYGLSNEEIDTLNMASPMHDIGKVGIADAILNKPGKLTVDEFEIMKTHAELGYKMLKNSNKDILKAAAIVSYEHHEKWDGSGYPRGLKENDIHIFGRITAIADVFDALGSNRVYKKAWELNRILELFNEQSGKHFDPKLIGLFLDNLDDFLVIRDKYQD